MPVPPPSALRTGSEGSGARFPISSRANSSGGSRRAPVDPAASYRVTVNNFLAGGGDGFTRLTAGTDPLVGVIDLDSFVAYGRTASPIAPPALDRITQVP